jgi:toxin ParE1/3/4
MQLVFSRNAEADIENVGDYIAKDNPSAAIAFVQRLLDRCSQIAQFPGIGRRRSDLKSAYRSVTEGQYVILYIASSDKVEIVRVLHGKQDIERALKS